MMFNKVSRQALVWYNIALVIVVLDQLTKFWAAHYLNYDEPLVLTSFFNFTLRYNFGAAFSFLSDQGGWQRWFFTGISVVASIFLAIWIARSTVNKTFKTINKSEVFALTFILGGALGNLYDRALLGYVVDFIEVHYQDYYWPAFNLADSAITLGVIVLIADLLLKEKKEKEEKKIHA